MPPLLAPVEIHFCGYTGLNAWTIVWWSVAACQMSRSDQLAGSGTRRGEEPFLDRDLVAVDDRGRLGLERIFGHVVPGGVQHHRPVGRLVEQRQPLLEGALARMVVVDGLGEAQHEELVAADRLLAQDRQAGNRLELGDDAVVSGGVLRCHDAHQRSREQCGNQTAYPAPHDVSPIAQKFPVAN
jgi:hypothetical protein